MIRGKCCRILTSTLAGNILPHEADAGPQSRIVAIGHFGNFELYARFGQFVPIFKCATTYRALKQPALNRHHGALRESEAAVSSSGAQMAAALKAAMNDTGLLLGLLADQSSQRLRLPFLGHDCDTSAAPAIFACATTARCTPRSVTASAWQIGGLKSATKFLRAKTAIARSSADIMRDVNRAFEIAVRRDPANWFWVHNAGKR